MGCPLAALGSATARQTPEVRRHQPAHQGNDRSCRRV